MTNGNADVTVILTRYCDTRKEKDEGKLKLWVTACCRVSMDSEEQATSYEAQIEHYMEYIKKNSEWKLAEIFADEGFLAPTSTNEESLII